MKHAVLFSDAVAVIEDNTALTAEGDHPGEDRYVTIGWMPSVGRWWWFTHGAGDTVPIISARKATQREHLQYEG